MLTFISSNPIASCLIVIVALIILEALSTQFGQNTSFFMAKVLRSLAVLAGIPILLALYMDQSSLQPGWLILLSMIFGPLLGLILDGIHRLLVFLWISLTYKIFHNESKTQR